MQTLACVAGVKIWARESVWGGECVVPLLPRARSRALIPFPFPFERLPRRLCNHINCCSLPHLVQYTTGRTLDTNFTCDELNESYSVAH